ncbi:hypothetical protein H5410_034962 [Solanum commersonii]|uniref:Uncharacterized protein n=1 Tax=Solanum commersonii TaxID=4109 RepID=A0A9J5Y199_SOLCO|nr:hypothetical protein H5410_034962 [Solanum commersonii]
MDYKYESVGDHPAPARPQTMTSYAQHPQPPMSYTQLPSLTYFSQQAIRAGYVAPPHFENKPDHIQHQPANMREAIMKEIEKERIREKIIAEEIARRRMEFDVRRELMMERQLAKQSGEGSSPFSSPTLPFLKQQSDVTSLEERIASSQMGRGISVSSRFGARN